MKIPYFFTISAGILAASMLPCIQTGCSKSETSPPTTAATPAPAAATPAPAPVVAATPAPKPVVAATAVPAAPAAAAEATPGPSSILATNAWKALADKNYDDVVKNTQQCIDQFKAQAIEQQKALTAPPTDKAEVFKQWALNDVGTCYYILGQAYEKQNKNKEAAAAYQSLVTDLPFAQCWDPKGWFWKPAGAAKDRLKALQLDTLN